MFWLVVWNIKFIFPYIGNVIIPTDELIFFRGVAQPPTSVPLQPFCVREWGMWSSKSRRILPSKLLGFQRASGARGVYPLITFSEEIWRGFDHQRITWSSERVGTSLKRHPKTKNNIPKQVQSILIRCSTLCVFHIFPSPEGPMRSWIKLGKSEGNIIKVPFWIATFSAVQYYKPIHRWI